MNISWLSIRDETIRFASMFILFTLFAIFMTLLLALLTIDSYQNHTKIVERDFLPYAILALISFLLALIFCTGSFIYIRKLFDLPTCFSSNI